MYKIETLANHMLVEFEDNFGYNAIRAVLEHQTQMPEYTRMHDIWMIGKHPSRIHLGELLSIVDDFTCHCPSNADRKKIAIVVNRGATEATIRLLARGVNRLLRFECEVFHSLKEAEEWLEVATAEVA